MGHFISVSDKTAWWLPVVDDSYEREVKLMTRSASHALHSASCAARPARPALWRPRDSICKKAYQTGTTARASFLLCRPSSLLATLSGFFCCSVRFFSARFAFSSLRRQDGTFISDPWALPSPLPLPLVHRCNGGGPDGWWIVIETLRRCDVVTLRH